MIARTFVDTNIFIYAIQSTDAGKASRATAWLRHLAEHKSGVANLQVWNELTNVLIKRGMMTPGEIFDVVDGYSLFGAEPLNVDTIAAARLIHLESGYSWWDCCLLASAIESRCHVFLTEDLQDQHRVRGLTIINPFMHSPLQNPLH